MSNAPVTDTGQLLWRLLPLVYRRNDGRWGIDPKRPTREPEDKGDLANLLDVWGDLLDGFRDVLVVRYADTSPLTCQPWLIPYFADMLDVSLVSPEIDGQREEVARAVSWRQRKGTLSCAAEIAQEVGRYERDALMHSGWRPLPTVVIQEGFRRVITTARTDAPLPTLRALGEARRQPATSPIEAAKRPGLPGGTVDFRLLSRARAIGATSPASRDTAFGAEGIRWRQEHPRGVPCHPDSYQDASVRTVDVRAPSWRHGHYHPRRLIVHAAAREGFFHAAAPDDLFAGGQLTMAWPDLKALFDFCDAATDQPFVLREAAHGQLRERRLRDFPGDDRLLLIERWTEAHDGSLQRERIAGLAPTGDDDGRRVYRRERIGRDEVAFIAGVALTDRLTLQATSVSGFGEAHPRIDFPASTLLNAGWPARHVEIRDVVCTGTARVRGVTLDMQRAAFGTLRVEDVPEGSLDAPPVALKDCLVDTLTVSGRCRLEYCTVLERVRAEQLAASDCILLGGSGFSELYLRYCNAPWARGLTVADTKLFARTITTVAPVFLSREFGKPGCAVLHPTSASAIRRGAEDGGELGSYHHRHYALLEEAVITKLRDFMPVTVQAALVPHLGWTRPVPPAADRREE